MNTLLQPATRTRPREARPAGFTLVEMLVAVGLVVLMLMLFAQIFGDTVRIMREQNSLANNDQKARGVETLLRADFARMTFRQPRVKGVTGLVPLRANWPVDPERQRGYFYISENDIENGQDDVIQFTIDGRETHRAPEVVSFKGRAAGLDANAFSPGSAAADVNQPDWDDGNFGDNVGESHAAEVVYFLRGGNLYRRQLLLREPRQPIDPDSTDAIVPPAKWDAQPGPGPYGAVIDSGNVLSRKFVRLVGGNWVGGDYLPEIDVSLTPGVSDFWHDFDYSAWNWWRDGDDNGQLDPISAGTDQYWLMFNGVDALKNVPGATPFPIAMPQHRFGHRPPISGSAIPGVRLFEGQPIEYLLTTSGALAITPPQTKMNAFIGRYTHEETSHPAFGYPGRLQQDDGSGIGNPMMNFAPNSGYAADWDAINNNSIIDAFEGGPRAGEDLILANVDSFDIEVWDDGYTEPDLNGNGVRDAFEDRNLNGILDNFPPRWVNLGHPGFIPNTTSPQRVGFYCHTANQNPVYGPRFVSPVAPFQLGTDAAPGILNVDDDGSGTNDNAEELGWPYSDDPWNRVFDTWHPGASAGAPPFINPSGSPTPGPPFQPLRINKPVPPATPFPQWEINLAIAFPPTFVIFPGLEDRDGDYSVTNANAASEDLNANGLLDAGEDLNNNGVLDGPEDRNGNGEIDDDLSYYYMPVGLVDSSQPAETGDKLPEWPREPGATVVDGNIIWKCFDNRVGLQMIRITIRYRDPSSSAPRQVSIVHSFVE